MGNLYKETLGKEDDFIEEDDRLKNIKDMEDPEELDAAEKLLAEEIDKTYKEENGGEKEETEEDETEEKEKEGEQQKLVNDEFIEKQPEEKREILTQFKDKSKEELVDIVAKSIAEKTPLGASEKTINIFKEQLAEKTDEELLQIITGVDKPLVQKEKEIISEKPFELPEIPKDDPQMKAEIDKQTLKRLKAIYPSMPEVESMESEAYKEWRRDLDIDNPDHNFKDDLQKARTDLESELSKIIFIQKELPNLFEESPEEVLPLLVGENIPRLRKLNDDPMGLLVDDIQTEVETIRAGLKKYGLTEKDLGMDFNITKDENGMPYNKVFNDLITAGKAKDGSLIPSERIIGSRGKTFWLKKGELAKKFKEEFDDKILTAFVAKKTQTTRAQKEKLKAETLIEPSGKTSGSNSKKVYTLDQIKSIEDPNALDKVIADLED